MAGATTRTLISSSTQTTPWRPSTPTAGLSSWPAILRMHTPMLMPSPFPLRCRYKVEKLLGQGTFGQVVQCVRQDTKDVVALKVIKHQQAFYQQVTRTLLLLLLLPPSRMPQC